MSVCIIFWCRRKILVAFSFDVSLLQDPHFVFASYQIRDNVIFHQKHIVTLEFDFENKILCPVPRRCHKCHNCHKIFQRFSENEWKVGAGEYRQRAMLWKKRCSGKIVGLTCCAILSNLLYVYDIHVHILFNTYYIHGIHRFKIWHRSSITTFHSFNLHCMRLHSKVQDMLYAWNSYIEHTPCG